MRLFLFLLLAAVPAAAAPRISVIPFSGPSAGTSRSQLVEALCETAECLPQGKVTSRNRPDWKKVSREKVDFLVAGKVVKVKRKQFLEVTVYAGPGAPEYKKRFPLSRGRLAGKSLVAITKALEKLYAKAAPEPEPEPEPDPEPVAETEPATEAEPEAKEDERPPEEKKSDEGLSDSASRSERLASTSEDKDDRKAADAEVREDEGDDQERRRPARDSFLSIEIGPDLLRRSLQYSQVQTPNLRSYSADLIVAPRVRVELYPLAAASGLISGLGVEGSYAMAVGLKSRPTLNCEPAIVASQPSGCLSYPTSLSTLEVAGKLRIRPLTGSQAAVVPTVGFRNASFAVGAASDGSTLAGLPKIAYTAALVGAGFEAPFSEGRFSAFGRFAYLPVLSAGEILSAAYFPNGSASGLDVHLGIGFRVLPNLEARLVGQFARYGLQFQTQASDTYIASGAVDQYVGGNLAVRYHFGG
ncbi:MAG: hypothetical protein ACOZIN_11605 [Myxococcota bacterium]